MAAPCRDYICTILQITIESDADLSLALRTFAEMSETNSPMEFRSLHALECIEVVLDRDDHSEPLQPRVMTSTRQAGNKRKRSSVADSAHTKKVLNI